MQSRGKVGPWSDLYALGGTVYKAITGETPAKAADRILEDGVLPLAKRTELGNRYSQGLLHSIDHAMRPKLSERPQSAEEWIKSLRTGPIQSAQAKPSEANPTRNRESHPTTPVNAFVAVEKASRKSISRGNLIWLGGGVMAIVLVLVGFAYFVTQNRPNQFDQPAQTAVDTFADASKPPQTIDNTFASTSKTAPYMNTLDMAFVPAGTPGVLFSVWEARVKDFKAFVEEPGHDAISDNNFGSPAATLEKMADG
jgi:serine/threonine protein kinase